MLTRRSLLAGAAVAPLAGCATPQPGVNIIQQIIDTVQQWAAVACGIIPTAQSILSLLAGFGVPLTGVGAIVLQQVEQAICAAVPPPASVRYRSIPLRTAASVPGFIGNAPTPNGPVPIHGWRTR